MDVFNELGIQARLPDGTVIPEEVMARHMLNSPLYQQWLMEQQVAAAEQRLIAAEPIQHGRKFKVIARVTESVLNHWRGRFTGQTESDGQPLNPWAHDEFIRDLQRDNPELRPNIQKRQDFVGYGDGAGLGEERAAG